MRTSYRIALLGSALSATSLFATAPAQAACTVTPAGTPVSGTVTCATTTTTDTTYSAGTTASDRNYNLTPFSTAFTGTVSSGATVSGFGLAFTDAVGGANALNVVNDGTVQVNAGNLASAGGNDALDITAFGATPVNYSGTGSVTNLGTAGNAIQINMNGTGNLIANVGGNLTSAAGNSSDIGNGLEIVGNGGGGNLTATTATGTTVRADWMGVHIQQVNPTSAGALSLTNNATVASRTGAPNTLDFGVVIESIGTGSSTLVNNGAVGSATDRVLQVGVFNSVGQLLKAKP